MSAKKPLTEDDLVAYFLSGCRPRRQLRIGIEVEKPGVLRENGRTVKYSNGPRSYSAVVDMLVSKCGWEITREEDGYPAVIRRGRTVLSLETSGVIEFAGSTHQSLHDLALEYNLHVHELREISGALGIKWLGYGIQPVSSRQEHELVKKPRYRMVIEHFGRDTLFGSWTFKCNSVQVNLDFTSRVNLQRKFSLLTRIAPVLTAMFANSPINRGRLGHSMSMRSSIAQRAVPKRYNPPREFFQQDFTVEKFVQYALDLPVVYIQREQTYIPVERMTFREFMERGYGRYSATLEDFLIQISFVYTDVRLKRYIEFRSVDNVPTPLVPAVAATVKGLMYNRKGWQFIEELTKHWTYEEYCQFRNDVAKYALRATIHRTSALDLAKQTLNVATENLRSLGHRNIDGQDESIFLEPIKEYIFVHEQSPAEYVASKWETEWHKNIGKLIEWAEY
ncbi:hypothetical protein COU79_04280 [Candidatus Peregrinibacteria bacterium CG10_big_fil_rev_8_21_14_0_10_54_7]|nr:MAG: hypothetical protein COU79_04280 [Candidatus Peregrinibacteria bacterium CG10_big_fil_rev_8_21_14_0_10_54_7]